MKRQSLLIKGLVALILIGLIVAVGVGIVANREPASVSQQGMQVPSVVRDDGTIRITGARADVEPAAVVTVVGDYQCPGCAQLEGEAGDVLAQLGARQDVAVDYDLVAFLDKNFGTTYSTRAMNASISVAEDVMKGPRGVQAWLRFHHLLFERQKAEGGPGLSDDELVDMAREVGAGPVAVAGIRGLNFSQWIEQHTAAVTGSDGFQGTPWVRLNGRTIEGRSAEDLQSAVEDVTSGR